MRSLMVAVLLAALPGWLHLPTAVERWLYNPRERTHAAQRHLADGRPEAAMATLGTAARLQPADPEVRFNAGTGRMLTDKRGAVGELETATELLSGRDRVDPELAADAWYNLGTARLGGRDAAGAVAALQEALRQGPGDPDAQFNLELALLKLERQRSGWRRPRESPDAEEEGESEPGGGTGGTDTTRQPEAGAGGRRDEEPADQDDAGEQRPQEARRDLLQRFEQQPDMTAAQAAAILQAVENLERAYRRQEAERRGQRRQVVEKDW